jgi:serine/threonine protein kinase
MIDIGEIRTAFPDYQDLAPLGIRSGQKDVLRGRRGSEHVALKLIKPSQQDRDRTIREIEAVARLKSTFVPALLEHGVRTIGGESRLFLVEQFVEGGSYRTRLQTNPKPHLAFTLRLAASLLDACRDFEDANLVHRDIKPENILVGPDEKIWVIDFGIVRLLDQESLTATGMHFGPCTPGYGAPEQIRNLKSQIDSRTDLFSIGIVIYESLNGSNPHITGKRDVLEVIRAVESTDLPRLAHIDAELADFLATLTARFPSRRPKNARDAIEWFTPIHTRLCKIG